MNQHSEQDQKLFDAAKYWANKPIKKFVVTLSCRESDATETRIFAASCSDRASEFAVKNSDLLSPVVKDIHLATPGELGCEPVAVDLQMIKPPQPIKFPIDWTGYDLKPLFASQKPLTVSVLAAALADCLAMMQACEQHNNRPLEWPDPVGTTEWDVTIAVAALALKEVV